MSTKNLLSDAPSIYYNGNLFFDLYKTNAALTLQTGTAGSSQTSCYINLVGTIQNGWSPELEVSKWYWDNFWGLSDLAWPANLMVSSWAITVDLTWETVLTTPVAVYGTITAGVPAAVAQNSVTGRAIGSIGDHIGVLINVAG